MDSALSQEHRVFCKHYIVLYITGRPRKSARATSLSHEIKIWTGVFENYLDDSSQPSN
jgi:hypothetical protein